MSYYTESKSANFKEFDLPFPEAEMLKEIADHFKDIIPEDKWKSEIRETEDWDYHYGNRTREKKWECKNFEAFIIVGNKHAQNNYYYNKELELRLTYNPRYGWSYYVMMFDKEYGKRTESKGIKNMTRVFDEFREAHGKIQEKMDKFKEVGAFK